jgi:urease accessory protein
MLRLDLPVGNISTDTALAARVVAWREAGRLDEVSVEERQAHKSRLRLQTSKGRELGLVLPRGMKLADGDVFALADEEGQADGQGCGVLVHILLQEVMVLTLLPTAKVLKRLHHLVRLGHVLGNQHWPVAIVGEQVLVPVSLDRAVMETVLRTHHLTNFFSIHYERRAWPQEEATSH